jgi:hypothetical protein
MPKTRKFEATEAESRRENKRLSITVVLPVDKGQDDPYDANFHKCNQKKQREGACQGLDRDP